MIRLIFCPKWLFILAGTKYIKCREWLGTGRAKKIKNDDKITIGFMYVFGIASINWDFNRHNQIKNRRFTVKPPPKPPFF